MHKIKTDAYSAKGERGCCTVRATAAVLGISFAEAHAKLKALGRKDGTGFCLPPHLASFGLEERPKFYRRTLGKILPELKTGRFIVRISGHVFAVIDGKPCEDFWPTGTRVRMVYELVSP